MTATRTRRRTASPIELACADMRALAHPLRVRVLQQLVWEQEMKEQHEIGSGDASPSLLATRLDVELNNLSYHVRTLLEFNAIRLTRTEPRRGTVEHFYAVEPHIPALVEVIKQAEARYTS